MNNEHRTVILGAGLAGLSAAVELGEGYRIFEREKKPGGLCTTEEDSGFRFDKTGHLLHLSHPKAKKLVKSLLPGGLNSLERKSRIFSSGVYTHYPFQANTHGLPPQVVAHCLKGFIVAHEKRGGERAGASSFEEFILANFGEGIAEHFMIPYNKKLWGVHPREITDAWCDRFVPTPSLDEVVDGAVGLPRDNMGYNARFLYPEMGIGALAEAMAERVGDIELGISPGGIDHKNNQLKIKGRWVPYENLISSLPLDDLLGLLIDPPKKIVSAASKLRCTSLRYLDVALNRPSGTPYHWTYVPERKYPFYRVGSYSNFSKKVVPKGKGSLYVELASRGRIDLKKLLPKVAQGLIEMGIIRKKEDISFARPRFIKKAYVIYDEHREKSLSTIFEWLEKRRIFSVGRYGRWEYAAMENALVQGMEAASQSKE